MMEQIKVQMKIIIISLITVTTSSADVQVRNLRSIEGRSITLPDSVGERAFLFTHEKLIASVRNRELIIEEDSYRGRIHWNQDGCFAITGLQKNDSGTFIIDSKKEPTFSSTYKLIVYESVPDPKVVTFTVRDNSCILLCSVQKADGITLSWYSGEELLNQTSSLSSLSLTLLHQNLNSSYRCEASNPAENKSCHINVVDSCQKKQHTTDSMDAEKETRTRALGIAIPIVCLSFVVLFFFIFKRKSIQKPNTKSAHEGEPDLIYTEVVTSDVRNGQCNKSSLPAYETTNLTTIYSKLEV